MDKAVTAERMKKLDETAINKYGMPSILLMEKAGRAVAEEVIKRASRLREERPLAAIFCGRGNNGGDGLVCARYLAACGINTPVFIIGDISSIKGDPAVNLKLLQDIKVKITYIKNSRDLKKLEKIRKADIIVDAIFGIGFKGKAGGLYKETIDFINSTCAYIFAVDLPSGLDATTGEAEGPCIRADQTIAMGLPKTGFYKNDGPERVGRVRIVDIGLPKKILKTA